MRIRYNLRSVWNMFREHIEKGKAAYQSLKCHCLSGSIAYDVLVPFKPPLFVFGGFQSQSGALKVVFYWPGRVFVSEQSLSKEDMKPESNL